MDLTEKIIEFKATQDKYAAVYTRKSMKNENNSLEAQKELALRVLMEKQLLLYDVYEESISARKVSAFKRPEFKRLLSDAREGRFCTLVTFRHDRLSRDVNDWIQIKAELKRLGIRIIFTDTSEFNSFDNNPTSNFIENMLIMIAELEPSQTLRRASIGRAIRREQGVYNPGGRKPFGYDRIQKDEDVKKLLKPHVNKSIKVTSYFKRNHLQAFFVVLTNALYNNSKPTDDKSAKVNLIIEKLGILRNLYPENITLEELNRIITDDSVETEDFHKKLSPGLIINAFKNNSIRSVFNQALKSRFIQLKETETEALEKLKKEINGAFKYMESASNYYNLIENPRYCGIHLEDSRDDEKAYIYDETEDKFVIDMSYFNDLINVDPLISKKDWEDAVCHFLKFTHYDSREKIYLLKSLLKCKKCSKKIYLFKDTFRCSAGCTSLDKDTMYRLVFKKLLEDALNPQKIEERFKKDLAIIKRDINTKENEISKDEKALKHYSYKFIKSHTRELAEAIEQTSSKIKELKKDLGQLQIDYQNLSLLCDTIQNLYHKAEKQASTNDYILKRLIEFEFETHDMLLSIIEEVVIEDGSADRIKLRNREKNRSLPESIN